MLPVNASQARQVLAAVARGEDPAAAEIRAPVPVFEAVERYLAHVEARAKPHTASEHGRLFSEYVLVTLEQRRLYEALRTLS